jgi:hypothetical protein
VGSKVRGVLLVVFSAGWVLPLMGAADALVWLRVREVQHHQPWTAEEQRSHTLASLKVVDFGLKFGSLWLAAVLGYWSHRLATSLRSRQQPLDEQIG